jgi:hypothetical protein
VCSNQGLHCAEQASKWKGDGNRAFKRGDFSLAIDLYSRAIDEPVHMQDMVTETPRRVAYLLNRAQGYLQRAANSPADNAPPDRCTAYLLLPSSIVLHGISSPSRGEASLTHLRLYIIAGALRLMLQELTSATSLFILFYVSLQPAPHTTYFVRLYQAAMRRMSCPSTPVLQFLPCTCLVVADGGKVMADMWRQHAGGATWKVWTWRTSCL